MNLKNRNQVCEFEQLLDSRVRAGQFQRASARLSPHMHYDEFAESSAIDRLEPTQVDDDLACVRQQFRDFLREGSGLVTISKAARAMQDSDVTNSAVL